MTSTPDSARHDGDHRDCSVARDAAMPAPSGPDVAAAARGRGAPTATEDPGRLVPVADGVAPTCREVAGMDWSGSRKSAAVGQLLGASADIDAARVRQLEALVRVVQDGAAEQVLGLPVEVVLAQSGRTTRRETSRLLKVARVLSRMPAVRHAFQTGQLSWSQVDAITWTVADLPVGRWADLDTLVADTALSKVDVEADSLVTDVEWAAARIAGELSEERRRTPVEDNRVMMQPRLDGSGDFHGSYDATHFPVFADRIDQLARDLEDVPDPATDDGDGDVGGLMGAGLTEAHRQAAKVAGRNAARRAGALFGLVTGWDADTLHPLDPDDSNGDGVDGDDGSGGTGGNGHGRRGAGRGRRDGGGAAGRPSVLVTTDLDALLDGTTPVWLVNRLAGRMHVTADVARRWMHVHGADVRLVVMDHGQPVGVGDRKQVPPGWLRDAIIARDLHDTAPTSTTPALLCDIDHTVPWDDDDPAAGGTTDVGNLALVSRRWHTRKTRGRVHLDRHPDGSATWTVTATGYRVNTAPPPHLARRESFRPAAWRRLDDIPPPDHPTPRWAALRWPDAGVPDPGPPDPGRRDTRSPGPAGSGQPGLGGPTSGHDGHDRAPP